MAKHSCDLNYLANSDGSALYSCGGTVMLTSVFGPGGIKVSSRLHNEAYIDVLYSSRSGMSSIREKYIENIIMDTVKQVVSLRQYPRAGITITIQEMQVDGDALSAAINATCLALLDSSIELCSPFISVNCCLTEYNTCVIEPPEVILKESTSNITFIFNGKDLSLLSSHQQGSLSSEQFSAYLAKCQLAAKDVVDFYRKTVNESYHLFMDDKNIL